MGADRDSGGASLLPARDQSSSAPPPSSGLPPVAAAANLLEATSWLTPPGTKSSHARFAFPFEETRVSATVAVARGGASGRIGGPRALTASTMPPERFVAKGFDDDDDEEVSSSEGTGAATRDASGGGGSSHEGAAAWRCLLDRRW